MPQSRNSETPPKVMTWPNASWVLIAAGVFDLLRAFFNLFWFFGPAMAALYCSSTVSGWVGSVWGLTDVACNTAAVAVGVYFSPVIASFGVIMADAVALLGYLFLTFLVFSTNARILKTVRTAMMQIGASFGIAALPFIGAIPTFTITLYKLYRRQIKLEKAAYRKWEKENADARLKEQRQQQAAEITKARNAEAVLMQQQEAATAETYAEAEQEKESPEAANDEKYEPLPARVIPRLVAVPDYTRVTPPLQTGGLVDTSRRDFMKKAGALAVSSAVGSSPATFAFAETEKELASGSTGQTYEQGIELLRKDALTEKSERVEIFVVKKDGKNKWLKIPENEVTRNENHTSFSYKVVDDVVYDKDVARVDIVHTHPLRTITNDAGLISRVQKGEAEPPAMPPSMADIIDLTIARNTYYKQDAHKLGTVVVDPAGTWRAEVADNPKSLLLIKQKLDESESLINELSAQDDAKEIFKKIEQSGQHPATVFMELQGARARLSQKTNKLVDAVAENFQDLAKDPGYVAFMNKMELVSGGHQVLTDQKKIEEIKNVYKGIGVNLTFTPHPANNK